MSDIIVCQQLTKQYGDHKVVDRLDLRVPGNIVFGFLGPNGAGKSTTMKLLTGQIKPTGGTAWVAGADVTRNSLEARRHIGYLSELPTFYPWMKGKELLELAGELFGLNPATRQARAKELLDLVGLTDAGQRKVGGYSGGMRQRLGIAQALVNRPKVVFLDEPVSALDPLGRRDVLNLLGNIRQEATVFMSSHVLADVDRVCDQVSILNRGQVIAAGTTTELKERNAILAIIIELDGNHNAAGRLAAAIQGESWLKNATTLDNGRLKVELTSENYMHEAGQRIPRLVSELELSLRSFQAVVPNLEDVFMQLLNAANEKAESQDTGQARVVG
jgi:ABC-2 type transport system ATP-binding protein